MASGPGVTAQTQIAANANLFRDNRADPWRYRNDNGRWWYWAPDNRWMLYDNNQWTYYQPNAAGTTTQSTPQTMTPGYNTTYQSTPGYTTYYGGYDYAPGYYGSSYPYYGGYYGGWGSRYGGWGGYGRGWRR